MWAASRISLFECTVVGAPGVPAYGLAHYSGKWHVLTHDGGILAEGEVGPVATRLQKQRY